MAVFFDPHPRALLRPEKAPPLLTTATRRIELLRGLGIDEVVAQLFDEDFASLSPEAFVTEVLVARLAATAIVVGPDFRFGKEARGTTALLRSLGDRHGFEVETVDPVLLDGDRISSTRVRNSLMGGDVTTAARLLGRWHDVDGQVVPGDARGRAIGFRTANLEIGDVLVPADGVYAILGQVADGDGRWGRSIPGVANLGSRPTFGAGRSVEVHFLDFDGDLYGGTLRVFFVARLRDEARFDGIEALRRQIEMDIEGARSVLADVDGVAKPWT